jgi:hypothetical protein
MIPNSFALFGINLARKMLEKIFCVVHGIVITIIGFITIFIDVIMNSFHCCEV